MRRGVFTGGLSFKLLERCDWLGLIDTYMDTYMDTYNSPKIPEHQSYTIDRLL